MNSRKILFCLSLLLALFANKQIVAQTTFNVTDPVLGHSINSLDKVLTQAVNSANLGNNVTVLFNSPSLCVIDEVLPLLEISNGSLTLKKDPLTFVPQGIRFATHEIPNIVNGFFIKNTNPLTSINIEGLDIRYFQSEKSGINIDESNNVTIKDCNFFSNSVAIMYDNSSFNLLIQHNTFLNNEISIALGGVKCLSNNQSGIVRNSLIKANIINSTGNVGIACGRAPTNENPYFKHQLVVDSNQITGSVVWGISIGTLVDLFDDISYNVTLNNNNINCITGLMLDRPFKQFVIDSNRFNTSLDDIRIDGNTRIDTYTENPYGIDFVGVNSIGLPVVNGSNVFSTANANRSSFEVYGDLGKGVTISGNTLPKRVQVADGRHTNVIGNRIVSNDMVESPILLTHKEIYGNENISAPSNVKLLSNGNTLTVKYYLSGNQISQSNGDFVVDFYKTNSNGDLLDYIGNQTISTLTSGEYTAQFTVSPSNSVQRIATTVTAYGNQSSPMTPIGTSQASYSSIPNCHCETVDFCFTTSTGCVGTKVGLTRPTISCPEGVSTEYILNYGDGTANTTSLSHTYDVAGNYTVMMIFPATEDCLADTVKKNFAVSDCEHNCIDCIESYAPIPGQKYVLSAWVMEENASPTKTAYTYPSIKLTFTGTTPSTFETFLPEGAIIDGWQRIEKEFTIPPLATGLYIELLSSTGNCFFDDIRVFPFDGTMKSYVYDPTNLRLVAELDEHNYATFYEYDEEGKLIRVKKETVKGVMTIKENKNSSVKRH